MGLARRHRMSTADHRHPVVRSGRRGSSGPLVVHVLDAGDRRARPADDVRVGFAVGRRVGSAVTRNAVRRRLREVAAGLLAAGEWSAGVTAGQVRLVVVRALPGAEALAQDGLGRDLRRAHDRAVSRRGRRT